MIPLFKMYPHLQEEIPYKSFSELPTPVHRFEKLGRKTGYKNVYIKRDDLTGSIYGGNKIRKLEFIFGDILRKGKKKIATFGFAGSNHAVATEVCARQLGLQSISILLPQTNANYVRENLLLNHNIGSELVYRQNWNSARRTARFLTFIELIKNRKSIYIIPPGGSSQLGIMGYINAALELKNRSRTKKFLSRNLYTSRLALVEPQSV